MIETNPLPGVKVASGTKVDIIYSSGKQSKKTIDVIVNLPKEVNADLQIKVYLDGVLQKEDTVNPSYNDLYPLSFEGTSGTQELRVTLNGQDYIAFKLDFDSGTPTELWSYDFVPDESTESEDETTSSEDNGFNFWG